MGGSIDISREALKHFPALKAEAIEQLRSTRYGIGPRGGTYRLIGAAHAPITEHKDVLRNTLTLVMRCEGVYERPTRVRR